VADPRLAELAIGEPTVNERLMAWSIRRSLYTLRLGNGEARRVVGLLNREVYPDVIRQVRDALDEVEARGSDVNTETNARLGALARTLREITRQGYVNAHDLTAPTMQQQATDEAEAVVRRINAVLPPAADAQAVMPAITTLRAIVSQRTVNGRLVRDWFGEASERTANAVVREINTGIAQGAPADVIVRRIRGTAANDYEDGLLDASRREVATLVRTAVRGVQQHARQITYRENGDIIERVKIVATLDHRTCPICGPLDGMTIPVDSERAQLPPFHPNCRCDTVPVVRRFTGLPPGQRASATGAVPSTVTFADWLRDQPRAVQEDVLGVRRAALWRSGRFTLGDFTDDANKVLTLKELGVLDAEDN